jgi:hypothetical protein
LPTSYLLSPTSYFPYRLVKAPSCGPGAE